jgi:hypothetical protein
MTFLKKCIKFFSSRVFGDLLPSFMIRWKIEHSRRIRFWKFCYRFSYLKSHLKSNLKRWNKSLTSFYYGLEVLSFHIRIIVQNHQCYNSSKKSNTCSFSWICKFNWIENILLIKTSVIFPLTFLFIL